jgi:hypothetical protein
MCRIEVYYFVNIFFNIDDIKNLLTNLEHSDLVVSQVWSAIVSKYNEGGDISDLLAEYAKDHKSHINNVINMLHNVPDNTLSDKQKAHDQIRNERI